ncbi:MAG: nucleotidyltransferase domain-containing protein, partial [Enterobacterales bacterium]|nr:nucleotidyltransferase domain-containing protein [Enterobacterales bacterium]
MQSQDKIIQQVIQNAQSNDDIELLWLYGSRSRGNASNTSDYDFAIAFKNYIEDPVDRRLRPELLAIDWQQQLKVDLSIIDFNQVPIPMSYS